jgi:hypothetical protein
MAIIEKNQLFIGFFNFLGLKNGPFAVSPSLEVPFQARRNTYGRGV